MCITMNKIILDQIDSCHKKIMKVEQDEDEDSVHFVNPSKIPPTISLRKGKWTTEEENYANKIIYMFNRGSLLIPAGTTLRTYLSDKLHW